MFSIRGEVKDYDWGIINGLEPWTGEAPGGPQAELWFGVHPSGPSSLDPSIHDKDTDDTKSAGTLADRLTHEQAPVLAKILAAARPLSVQVHPNAHDAKKMWADQQIAGPQILADPYEKAEVLVALQPFDAFVGWRPAPDAAEIIERIDGLALAASALHSHDRISAIQTIHEHQANSADLVAQLPSAIDAAQAAGTMSRSMSDAEISAYRQAVADFPDDIGVLLTPLLDFVTLKPGDAVYLAPGIPHSYVRGIGFEVMTSSDNVLRLGLTSKAVYVDHALKILDFKTDPQFIQDSTSVAPQGAAFRLEVIRDGSAVLGSGEYRLVVAIEGSVEVSIADDARVAGQGMAVAISAGEGEAAISTSGLAIAVLAPASA
jgi:mannose-6-phosphate isomerase